MIERERSHDEQKEYMHVCMYVLDVYGTVLDVYGTVIDVYGAVQIYLILIGKAFAAGLLAS